MDNQHRRITGYRELNQEEIDLMNEIKALGPEIEAVLFKVKALHERQFEEAVAAGMSEDAFTSEATLLSKRREDSTPYHFLALAKTEFQTGLMYLTRAVAQPTFF